MIRIRHVHCASLYRYSVIHTEMLLLSTCHRTSLYSLQTNCFLMDIHIYLKNIVLCNKCFKKDNSCMHPIYSIYVIKGSQLLYLLGEAVGVVTLIAMVIAFESWCCFISWLPQLWVSEHSPSGTCMVTLSNLGCCFWTAHLRCPAPCQAGSPFVNFSGH